MLQWQTASLVNFMIVVINPKGHKKEIKSLQCVKKSDVSFILISSKSNLFMMSYIQSSCMFYNYIVLQQTQLLFTPVILRRQSRFRGFSTKISHHQLLKLDKSWISKESGPILFQTFLNCLHLLYLWWTTCNWLHIWNTVFFQLVKYIYTVFL